MTQDVQMFYLLLRLLRDGALWRGRILVARKQIR